MLPALPISLLLSLPSYLPVTKTSPHSPIQYKRYNKKCNILHDKATPHHPITKPSFQERSNQNKGLQQYQKQFHFTQTYFTFKQLPPFQGFQYVKQSRSMPQYHIHYTTKTTYYNPSYKSKLHILQQTLLQPTQGASNSGTTSQTKVYKFTTRGHTTNRFNNHNIKPTFRIMSQSLHRRNQSNYTCNIFRHFIINRQQQTQKRRHTSNLSHPRTTGPIIQDL